MKRTLPFILPVILATCLLATCKKPAQEPTLKDVEFAVPETVSLEKGTQTLDFRVQFQKAPLVTDQIVLTDASGSSRSCSIIESKEFILHYTFYLLPINSPWWSFRRLR